MKKLKLISMLCALVMLFGTFAVFPVIAVEPTAWTAADGAGTAGKTYLLNAQNFKEFCEANLSSAEIKGNYVLTEDVTVNEGDAATWATTLPSTVWSESVGRVFSGSFDGQGKTISGICIVGATPSTKVGLFGIVSGEVKNLRLVNSYFESIASKAAATADPVNTSPNFDIFFNTNDACEIYTLRQLGFQGTAEERAEFIKSDEYKAKYNENKNSNDEAVAKRTTDFWKNFYHSTENDRNPILDKYTNARHVETGSIAARVSGTITNIYTNAYINNKTQDNFDLLATGGIVGMISSSEAKVDRCVFAGNILRSVGSTGGIVGYVSGATMKATVSDCLNIGKIHSTSDRTGGILGWDQSVSCLIAHCMNLSVSIFDPNNSVGEAYGSGMNHNMTITDFVTIKGIRTRNKGITSSGTGIATGWSVHELTLADLLGAEMCAPGGKLAGWNYSEDYLSNPTDHTQIGIGEIFNSDVFKLSTEKRTVRISADNAGLRFETTIGNADMLPFLEGVGAKYEMNTLITAGKYVEGVDDAYVGAKTSDLTPEGLDKIGKKYLTTTATKYIRTMPVDGYIAFAGSVVNINDKEMDFIGRGYITITYKGQTYNIFADYENEVAANVSEVALEEVNNTTISAEGKYKNEVTNLQGDTVYSIYTKEQYDVLKSLVAS